MPRSSCQWFWESPITLGLLGSTTSQAVVLRGTSLRRLPGTVLQLHVKWGMWKREDKKPAMSFCINLQAPLTNLIALCVRIIKVRGRPWLQCYANSGQPVCICDRCILFPQRFRRILDHRCEYASARARAQPSKDHPVPPPTPQTRPTSSLPCATLSLPNMFCSPANL